MGWQCQDLLAKARRRILSCHLKLLVITSGPYNSLASGFKLQFCLHLHMAIVPKCLCPGFLSLIGTSVNG